MFGIYIAAIMVRKIHYEYFHKNKAHSVESNGKNVPAFYIPLRG